MFGLANKYKDYNHFFFNPQNKLRKVCNAPTDKGGVYLVYALKSGKVELVYVGSSGKLGDDGTIIVRKSGLGGIKEEVVNGHQFGKIPRRKSWITQMQLENIDALDIYWYVTQTPNGCDSPRETESQLLQRFQTRFGRLPLWNLIKE